MRYQSIEAMLLSTAAAIRPPERLSVSEAAEKYRIVNNPGSYVGPWMNSTAPYLVEIMDMLQSTDVTAVIFAGPARCGKSDIFFNWLEYTAICDPADMMVVHMKQATARDWSIGDLRKTFRSNPALNDCVVPGRQNMNVHDIHFMSGMRLLVKWPTITELSGKTVPRVWFMDYDRMDNDVDQEGPPFDLGRKRTQTFGRYGMTVAEASPGYEVEKAGWRGETPHEAPLPRVSCPSITVGTGGGFIGSAPRAVSRLSLISSTSTIPIWMITCPPLRRPQWRVRCAGLSTPMRQAPANPASTV